MEPKSVTVDESAGGTTPDVSRRELVGRLLGVAGAGTALSVLSACAGEYGEALPDGEGFSEAAAAIVGAATVLYTDEIGIVPVTSPAGSENLRGTVGAAGQIMVARGFWSGIDGGGGIFYWDTTTTGRDDGGTYIVPNTNAPVPPAVGSTGAGWRRIYSGPLNVKWFGVHTLPDTGDSAPGIQRAINVAAKPDGPVTEVQSSVYIPAGFYFTFSAIVIPRKGLNPAGLTISGDGVGASVIRLDDQAETVPVIGFDASEEICARFTLERMTVSRNNPGAVFLHLGSEDARLSYAVLRDLDLIARDGAQAERTTFSTQSCVYLGRADSCVLDNLTIQGGEVGLYLNMSARCRVNGIYFGRHLSNSTFHNIVIRGGSTHTFSNIFLGAGYWIDEFSSSNQLGAGIIFADGDANPPTDIVFTNISSEGLKAMSPVIDIQAGRRLTFINAEIGGPTEPGFGVLIREGAAFVKFIGGYFITPDSSQNVYILSGSTPTTQTSDITFDEVHLDGNLPYASVGISPPAKRVRLNFTLGNQTSGLARFPRVGGVSETLALDISGVAHVAAADVWRVPSGSLVKYLYDGYEGQIVTMLLESNVSFWPSGNVVLSTPLPGTFTEGTLSLIYDTTTAMAPNTGTWREVSRAIV